jgi:nucleoid-associated protein YgaU
MRNETSTSIGLAVVLAFAIVFGLILTRQSSQYDVSPATKSTGAQANAETPNAPGGGISTSEQTVDSRDAAQPSVAEPPETNPHAVAEASGKTPSADHAGEKRERVDPPVPKPTRNNQPHPEPSKIQIPVDRQPEKLRPEPKPAAPPPALPGEPADDGNRTARAGEVKGSKSDSAKPTGGADAPRYYVVQPKDNLFKVAKAVFGISDRRAVRALYEANSDRLKSANRLKVGQRLRIPHWPGQQPPAGTPLARVAKASTEAKPSAESVNTPSFSDSGQTSGGSAALERTGFPSESIGAPPRSDRRQAARLSGRHLRSGNSGPGANSRWHVVRQNESLSDIARKELGNGRRWPEIWTLNKDRIRRPDRLAAGMKLRLPPEAPVQVAAMPWRAFDA